MHGYLPEDAERGAEPRFLAFPAHCAQGPHFLVEPIVQWHTFLRALVDNRRQPFVAISLEDARQHWHQPPCLRATVSTANGSVQVAPVLLKEIEVGEL